MATTTQFNPNAELNAALIAAGASKTVYALVTPETERAKAETFGDAGSETRAEYLEQFRDAWTGKQDRYHEEFIDTWHAWSRPLVDLDRNLFPFSYPTAGASESIRHLIFDLAARTRGNGRILVFAGEYEGYRAMAEAAGLTVIEIDRDNWQTRNKVINRAAWEIIPGRDLFFISQPSAIDGNVWADYDEFMEGMPANSVVVDVTYVGAVHDTGVMFNMNYPAVRNVVFSLSKPFGAYYDRVGGVFCREEDLGLFGNKWFKGLTGIRFGTILLNSHSVFYLPQTYAGLQQLCVNQVAYRLGIPLRPADVFILGNFDGAGLPPLPINEYLKRAGKLRVCVTPGMSRHLGTSGAV
jgi:hypothetical protein